ncbi:MAG TPA: sulfite exporter TauE/SafE family protein [Longimicrobiales bacterium]|nr:sulfite exporter TauE/SafE family protein [Longimicrobiales bacterium]
MTLGVLAALIAVGLIVGFVSGLIGIGGGVLIVPFLYFFYGHSAWSGLGVDPSLEATLAHATSLFVIVPTGMAAAATYHRAGLIAWRAALPIAAVAAVAAFAGAHIAVLLPGEALKTLFGLLLVGAGLNLLRERSEHGRETLRLTLPVVVLSGIVLGLLSALLGVGGGILAIPILVYAVGLDIRRVAATSITIVALTAASGTIAYGMAGWDAPGRPWGSIGYIHLVAGIPILVASLTMVRAGALANQRLNTRTLRLLFAGVFVLLGIRLVLENAGHLL